MHKRALFHRHAASLALCSIVSCQTSEEPLSIVQQPAYVLANSVWSSTQIGVCWENPTEENADARAWTRSAIEDTWEAHSQLRFYGWGPCYDDSRGIRILVNDAMPHVKRLGSELDGWRDGMVLNFSFENWGEGCQDTREFCIRAIAVHEFGHAIGFAHEQNRPDTPDWCDDVQGSNGDVIIGPWDEDSVMNYCNDEWNNDGELSEFDIQAVSLTYGTGEIRGVALRNVMAGNCMDVEYASTDNGANVHSWQCHGDLNQKWDLVPRDGGFQVVSRRSFKCLDIDAWSTDDGANAHQWDCHGGTNQRFELRPHNGAYMLVAMHSGKCVDVDWGSPDNGTNIHQWACHGADNQLWEIVY